MQRGLAMWSFGFVIACSADPPLSATESALSAGAVTTFIGEVDAQFGFAVATGDINQDGKLDTIVTAPLDDWGPVDCLGALYALFNPTGSSANSWDAKWEALCPSQLPGAFEFGVSLAVADINGDGSDDIVVGAPGAKDASNLEVGGVYVFGGSKGDTPYAVIGAHIAVMGTAGNGRFGAAVATGDVDGDGRDDVIVGAPGEGAGVIRVYRSLGSTWLDPTPTSVTAGTTGDQLGAALAAADFNADGKADVLAGAPNASSQKGTATVFAGASTGVTSTVLWTTTGKANAGRFGESVAIGDLGGDTRPDVVVGAPNAQSGAAHVFVNSAGGLATTATTTVSAGSNGARFGAALAAGDTEGDGHADLVVGAPLAGGTGAVHVYRGTASGLATSPYATRTGALNTGRALRRTGDRSRDGERRLCR